MKIIIEILKLIAGVIVFSITFVCGFFYTTIKHFLKWDYSLNKQLIPIIKSIYLAFDGLACAGGGEMLNDALRIQGKIKFGKWFQTISAVTGLIYIYEKDTWLRRFLDKILGENHCVDAITEQDNFYYKNH